MPEQPQQSNIPQPKINAVVNSIQAKERNQAPLEPHEEELRRKMDLLSRVRVNRERLVSDRGKVLNPKPGKHYVWVNSHVDRQTEYASLGYDLCRDPEIKTRAGQISEDGSHRRGDLVLYEIPTDLHEAMYLDNVIRGIELIEAPKEEFRNELRRSGTSYYDPPRA